MAGKKPKRTRVPLTVYLPPEAKDQLFQSAKTLGVKSQELFSGAIMTGLKFIMGTAEARTEEDQFAIGLNMASQVMTYGGINLMARLAKNMHGEEALVNLVKAWIEEEE